MKLPAASWSVSLRKVNVFQQQVAKNPVPHYRELTD